MASNPSSFDKATSSSTKSGASRTACSTAAAPSAAIPTTPTPSTRSSRARSDLRVSAESSASTTRTKRRAPPSPGRHAALKSFIPSSLAFPLNYGRAGPHLATQTGAQEGWVRVSSLKPPDADRGCSST